MEWLREAALLKAAILGLGLLLQAIRWGDGALLFAPSFYLTGMTPLLSGPVIGGFAVLFGWLFVLGLGETRVLLPLMALMAGLAGFAFGQWDMWVMLNMGLLLTPVGLCVLAGRFPLHVCRGVRSAVPVMTNSLKAPEFRRVNEQPVAEDSAPVPPPGSAD